MSSPARHPTTSGRHRLSISSIALAFVALSAQVGPGTFGAVHAETSHKAHHSKIVPTNRAAPDITATIPKKESAAKKPPPTVQPDDESLPPPFNLPNAPKSRMRACGEQWEAIKMTGRAASQTWRDFATKCLAGPSEAARTIP